MKVSVLIPARNCAAIIRTTLDSVLRQTVPADEILVMDDGSTDETSSILSSYKAPVRVLRQENRGVAPSRNTLCEEAQGDLIAFLDSDDLWHPSYLQMQRRLFADYPGAVAFFTGHVDFFGYGTYEWKTEVPDVERNTELIAPLSFLKRYNQTTGPFASMSYCCVPKSVLASIGLEPFRLSGVDDSYLCTLLPLLGPVVYAPVPLVAYRVTNEAQSVNRLKTFGCWVTVFEILQDRFEKQTDQSLLGTFKMAFASKRRQYGKLLMSVGRISEARRQFLLSSSNSRVSSSFAKSIALLLSSYMPSLLQPRWPPVYRQWKQPDSEMSVRGTWRHIKPRSVCGSKSARGSGGNC